MNNTHMKIVVKKLHQVAEVALQYVSWHISLGKLKRLTLIHSATPDIRVSFVLSATRNHFCVLHLMFISTFLTCFKELSV